MKKERADWISEASSSAASWPDTTVAWSGSKASIRAMTSSTDAPGVTWTAPPDNLPERCRTVWAVGRSKNTHLVPPRLLSSPNTAIPVRVSSRRPARSEITVTGSPISKPPSSAVPRSSATCPPPCGYEPSTIVNPPVS